MKIHIYYAWGVEIERIAPAVACPFSLLRIACGSETRRGLAVAI
jgi:hypothetical protein